MSTTIQPQPEAPSVEPAGYVADPDCTVDTPGHRCTRRDGQLLTGSNGVCHLSASRASYREGAVRHFADRPETREQPTYCSVCHRTKTFNLSGVCDGCGGRS